MTKEKKISFKYFPNKQLKPITMSNGKEWYPVYVRVIFDQNSTQFLFPLQEQIVDTKNASFEYFFEEKKHPEIKKEIESFEAEMTKIIRFESRVLNSKFSIKGISQKLAFYHKPLVYELERYLRTLIVKEAYMNTNNDRFLDLDNDYLTLYEAYDLIKKEIPDLKNLISNELSVKIKTLMALLASDLSNLISYEPDVKIIDWLGEDSPRKFKSSVLNYKSVEERFPIQWIEIGLGEMSKDFPVNPIEISKYMFSIEKMIVAIQR